MYSDISPSMTLILLYIILGSASFAFRVMKKGFTSHPEVKTWSNASFKRLIQSGLIQALAWPIFLLNK